MRCHGVAEEYVGAYVFAGEMGPSPSGAVPAFLVYSSPALSSSMSSSRLPGPPETPTTSTGPTRGA